MAHDSKYGPEKERRLTKAGRVATGIAGLAFVAAVTPGVITAIGAKLENADRQSDKEIEQLHQKLFSGDQPYKSVMVEDFNGALDIIRLAYPEALEDPERLFELEKLIQSQGKGENHMLVTGQEVRLTMDSNIGVPVFPEPADS